MLTEIKFKGRKYTFEKTITTQLTDQYVPDWGIYNAVRESAQNAYDEALMASCDVVPWMNGNELYLRDTGRGVEFEDILHIGASGKRGVDGVVGEHGEGEIVSFVAAQRLGVTKIMASRDWLATAGFTVVGKHTVLQVHLYKTDSPRKGTGWLYRIEEDSQVTAYDLSNSWDRVRSEFKKHRAINRKRERVFLSRASRGMFLSRGIEINSISGVLLNYDLDMNPGRDRSKFSWDQVSREVESLLSRFATPEIVSDLLFVALDYGTNYREFELLDLSMPREIVQRGAYLRTNKRSKNRITWATSDQASRIADAKERGIKVVVFQSRSLVPTWITDNFPNVREAISSAPARSKGRRTPNDFAEAVSALFELIGENPEHPIMMHSDLGEDIANTDGTTINFNYSSVKQMTTRELLGTIAHELAHDRTGALDCTRAHTNGMENILSLVAENLATSEKARALYKRAATRMSRWAK